MKLMTKKEAMEDLRLRDERTLLRLVKNGLLPYRMHGNRMMFAEDDLDEYLRKIRRVGRKDVPPQSRKDIRKVLGDFKEALLSIISAIDEIRDKP